MLIAAAAAELDWYWVGGRIQQPASSIENIEHDHEHEHENRVSSFQDLDQ